MENLYQHEYYSRFQSVYYRIYKSFRPNEGIRLEFWGPAKHELPKQLLDELSDGEQFKWFDYMHPPWFSYRAPDSAVTKGRQHEGVSRMLRAFDMLSIKVGWRKDKESGGNIIAVHFSIYKNSDEAMNSVNDFKKGGIDFNSDKMNLSVQNNGGEIKFHIDPAMLEQLQNAPGFEPVIIDMRPLATSLPEWLGTH